MSVITVALLLSSLFDTNNVEFGVQVGGLNQSEFEDLNAFSGTPTRFHSDLGDTFVATWKLIPPENEQNVQLHRPPVGRVAPYLQRIKLWGYKITFYENYLEGLGDHFNYQMSKYSSLNQWILEKESRLIVLPPPLPTTTGITTPTSVGTSTITTSEIMTTTPEISTTNNPVDTTIASRGEMLQIPLTSIFLMWPTLSYLLIQLLY